MPLRLHGEELDTVFHLLGKNENDMTKSLGWCLSQVPSFLDALGGELGTPDLSTHHAVIRLQEHQLETGSTDLEIYAPGYAAWIIEAKRGFTVPSVDQLEKYAARLAYSRTAMPREDWRSLRRRTGMINGSHSKFKDCPMRLIIFQFTRSLGERFDEWPRRREVVSDERGKAFLGNFKPASNRRRACRTRTPIGSTWCPSVTTPCLVLYRSSVHFRHNRQGPGSYEGTRTS